MSAEMRHYGTNDVNKTVFFASCMWRHIATDCEQCVGNDGVTLLVLPTQSRHAALVLDSPPAVSPPPPPDKTQIAEVLQGL